MRLITTKRKAAYIMYQSLGRLPEGDNAAKLVSRAKEHYLPFSGGQTPLCQCHQQYSTNSSQEDGTAQHFILLGFLLAGMTKCLRV